MGKVDYFTIILNKPQPIYFAGENLRGFLNMRIKERFKINSVKMTITGGARVHWTEQRGSGKSRRTVSYNNYEKYLQFDLLFIQKQGDLDLYLEPGDYSYPFDIVLPPNLPTSFEHSIGQVRYSLHGTIDIPWAFDKHTKKSFTVISHLDLNVNPSLRQSYGVSGQKVLCCGPCKSDPIVANFSIFKCGYVSGEAIVFNVQIDNKSNREIKEMTVNIIQKLKFHATSKTKTCVRNVALIKYPNKISERSQVKWDNSVLVIPPVCSSSNGTCRIIDVSYDVVFNFDASGIAVSTDLAIPILVGTIPLTAQAQMPLPNIPFSYEESVFDPVNVAAPDIKGEMIESDENTFKPYYPYYKDFSVQQY